MKPLQLGYLWLGSDPIWWAKPRNPDSAEEIIETHCDHHGTCRDTPVHQNELVHGLVFLGPVICLVMLIVGIVFEWRIPADHLNSGEWPVSRIVSLMAYLVAFVAGGTHILGHALEDLREGRITIDFLMILAAAGAAVIGDLAEGAILLFLFSLSHALEHFILGRTRRAITELMHLTPDDAIVIREGVQTRIMADQLVVGDIVLVQPSARIPADGALTVGQTTVDQSPMTGESIPVDKQPGDPLFAGTLNQLGSIQMRVMRVSSETTLARMVKLVEEAHSERAESQNFTDWFGQRYTWLVLAGVSVVLLVGLYGLNDPFVKAFHRAMTVLVVTSPCAVVISVPAAILSAITSAARGGVLFKGGSHLEQAARLRVMGFDKTGTLTLGRPHVVELVPAEGISETDLLAGGASLECHSEHPLARAVVEEAARRGIAFQRASEVQSTVGRGIAGRTNDNLLRVGKWEWFRDEKIAITDDLIRRAESLQADGMTVICVGDAQRTWGLIAVADALRPTAIAAMNALRELQISPLVILSGDHDVVVDRIATTLGIVGRGGLLPEDKLRLIQSLRHDHGTIGMIGDGMNDAPSLAAADVGFSLGGAGTDVALETADVVLLADDLRRLPYAIALARRTQQIIRQNLLIAFGVMGLLLMTTVVRTLPLPLAVLGHEGSTVAVILNGLRLLGFPKPRPLAVGDNSV